MVHRRRFLKIYFVIFGRIFTVIVFYENFEMEVEQANFVTHFIISVQLLLYLII